MIKVSDRSEHWPNPYSNTPLIIAFGCVALTILDLVGVLPLPGIVVGVIVLVGVVSMLIWV